MLRRTDENILYVLIRRAGLLWTASHLSLASARLSCTPYNDDTADTLHLICLLREREGKTEWSCSLVPFCTLPASSSPLCSGSWWRMICDSKPKSLLIKGPPPLRQQCVLEQRGKRFVSSRREARRGFWQVSVTAEVWRESVCVFMCVHVCICHTNTHTLHRRRLTASWLWCGSRCHAPTIRRNQTLLLAALPSPRFCSHAQDHK